MLMVRLMSLWLACSFFSCSPWENTHMIPGELKAQPAPLAIIDLDTSTIQTIPPDSFHLVNHVFHNPAHYNIFLIAIDSLSRPDIPLNHKLKAVQLVVSKAEPYYSTAQSYLSNPDPIFTQLAVAEHLEALHFLNYTLPDSIAVANVPLKEREEMQKVILEASFQVKLYLAYCRSILFEQINAQFVDQ
jgi:hypothetical protein